MPRKTDLEKQVEEVYGVAEAIKGELRKVIVGQNVLVNRLMVAMMANGHILLEGVPGLAKTTAISGLAQSLALSFKRIQFTPDLLPSDLIGSQIYHQKQNDFVVKPGPIFAHFVLADEINRSPAKVQSALLEAMQERQVTIGDQTFALDRPFLVMATQNPIEQEGTYPLPEAQVDRFLLKTVIDYPTPEEELEIIERKEVGAAEMINSVASAEQVQQMQAVTAAVHVDESIKKYIVDLVIATRDPAAFDLDLTETIAFGASPRASLGLMSSSRAMAVLEGRAYVIPEDVKAVAQDVLRHRVSLTFEAQADQVKPEEVVGKILESIDVP